MTDPKRYRPGSAAWWFMRAAAFREAEAITDEDERHAAIAAAQHAFPMPITNRRNQR